MNDKQAKDALGRIAKVMQQANCPAYIAEDVSQEAMLGLLKGKSEYAETWQAAHWAVYSAMRKVLRQEDRHRRAERLTTERVVPQNPESSMELHETVEALLVPCTERGRFILEARAEGTTLKEVGEALKITKQRVGQIEKALHEKFKKRMEGENE